ncbi:MAG: apiosidase-like domain-containing protein, partial [Planctomycetota bacterium]
RDADPDAEVEAEIASPSGSTRIVSGFWDGNRVWRVRFRPGEEGRWTYRMRTRPSIEGIDGERGEFECRGRRATTPFLAHGPIRVSPNGRHFVHADGTPFFWLVDTAWNGALLSKPQDWERYLRDRAAKGFTGIQFVTTQWRTAYADADGRVAYAGFEKIRIEPAFYQRLDSRIDAVEAAGLLAVPVLIWTLGGEVRTNPGRLPDREVIRLARYQVARYGAHPVAWFLAGDGNYAGVNAERWKRIGRAVFGRGDHAPVFLHPQGMQWPYDAFREEAWLSAWGYQSGHGDDAATLRWIYEGPPARAWRADPPRPIINLEPPYEDHIAYQSRRRHTDFTVRRAIYWSLLAAPTAGSSYGAHGVWSWESESREPQEHGGTGIAKPWHEAMALPGSRQMGHMAELFGSIRWWDLRPDPALVEQEAKPAAEIRRTHIVYARDAEGNARLFVDGVLAAEARIRGDLSNWDEGFRLALANELARDRPWRGDLHRIAIYDRALPAEEVARLREGTSEAKPIVLYAFGEGGGETVRDTSSRGDPLDLRIEDPAAVAWIPGGGLAVRSPALIASPGPAAKVARAIRASGAIAIEASFRPADLAQAGPARIVTLSRDTSARNFTLGQKGEAYEVRFRTTETSANGEPALSTPYEERAGRHIAAARSEAGDLAVIYAPAGGRIALARGILREGLRAEWFDPRTGRRPPAAPGDGVYIAPDAQDWILVVR